MGAYLSEPVVEKHSTDESNNNLTCAASSMQGWRISQEDAHNLILDFDKDTSYFAVYDGHGGCEVAKFCAEKLPSFVKENQAYKDGNISQGLKDAFLRFDAYIAEKNIIEVLKKIGNPDASEDSCNETEGDREILDEDTSEHSEDKISNSKHTDLVDNIKKNIVNHIAFSAEASESQGSGTDSDDDDCDKYLDESSESCEDEDDPKDAEFIANMKEEPGSDSGSTAVVALIHGKELYVANAGDSRCVLCRNGKAIDMSLDHKPEDGPEQERIAKAGGRVTQDGRVNGGLNLSRAIGDHAYKQNKDFPLEEQMITALPDVQQITLTEEDEFIILACDGIWNYLSSQETVDFIKSKYNKKTKLSIIIEQLFDHCLAPNTMGDGTGCDNMTAIVIYLNGSKEQCNNSSENDDSAISTDNTTSSAKRSISPSSEQRDSKKKKSEDLR